MKFFNILKEYNNAIIKENKRLNSIYKTLLRESGDDLDDISDTEAIDDCDILEKDDDVNPENCDDSSCNEDDFDEMLEASIEDKSSEVTKDDTADNDLLVASEFFRENEDEVEDEDAATNEVEDLDDSETAEYDEAKRFFAKDDEDGKVDTQKKNSSSDELMSAEEFFAEDDKDDEDDKDGDLKKNTDDLMTADEFFGTTNEAEDDETNEDSLISKDKVINGSSKNNKKCDETEKKLISAMDIFRSSPANEAEEDQKSDDDVDDTVKTESKEESDKEESDKKEPSKEESTKDQSDDKDDDTLKESLREYRRNNAHLFID